MIKYHDRRTVTRSKQLKNAIWEERDIFQAASVYGSNIGMDSVRLLGVTATEIEWKTESVKQLDLFSFEEMRKRTTTCCHH